MTIQNQNYNTLTNIGAALFIAGIVFLFIKTWLGIIFIFTYVCINIYAAKKYPKEHKELLKNAQKNTSQSFKLKHLEGINFIDTNSEVDLSMPGGKILIKNKDVTKEFLISDITNATILEETTKERKDKSVVARAIVGGILLSPVGAVVGGLTALNPSYKENKNYYLQITTKAGEDIILTGKTQNLKTIKEQIVKNV